MAMGAGYLAQMGQNVGRSITEAMERRDKKLEELKLQEREHKTRLGLLSVLEKKGVVDAVTAGEWRMGKPDELKGNLLGIEMVEKIEADKNAAKLRAAQLAEIEQRRKATEGLTGFGRAFGAGPPVGVLNRETLDTMIDPTTGQPTTQGRLLFALQQHPEMLGSAQADNVVGALTKVGGDPSQFPINQLGVPKAVPGHPELEYIPKTTTGGELRRTGAATPSIKKEYDPDTGRGVGFWVDTGDGSLKFVKGVPGDEAQERALTAKMQAVAGSAAMTPDQKIARIQQLADEYESKSAAGGGSGAGGGGGGGRSKEPTFRLDLSTGDVIEIK